MFDKKRLWFLTIPLFYLPFVLLAHGCGSDTPDVKNRVPTVAAQLDQAQQAAKEAQAAADQAAQTQKNIQAAIDKLNGANANSGGNVKVDRPQTTNPGVVTSVGESKSKDGETATYTMWFTFAERGGFVKTFTPACTNQAIPVNGTIILNFHWQEYESGTPGCFHIDGYTVVK
jgi:hypothetical protein